MPYTLHEQADGVICTFTGDFSDEMLAANAEILGHPRFTAFKYQIVDLTAVTDFTISKPAIVKIAQMDMSHFDSNPTHKVAVVSSTLTMKGLNNMYMAYAQASRSEQTWPSRIFQSVSDALAWARA